MSYLTLVTQKTAIFIKIGLFAKDLLKLYKIESLNLFGSFYKNSYLLVHGKYLKINFLKLSRNARNIQLI